MFNWFKKKEEEPQFKIVRLKVAYTKVGATDVTLVWVNREATASENIKNTIAYLRKMFPKTHIVLATMDLTSDGMGPVFASYGGMADYFTGKNFHDFDWEFHSVKIKQ